MSRTVFMPVLCLLLSIFLACISTNRQAIGSPLPGNYNNDGRVDGLDFLVLQRTYGSTGSGLAADGNFDRTVDGTDLAIWEGTSPAIINHRRNANNFNATGTNYGSDELTDGSRIWASVYFPSGTFNDFYISGTPITLTEGKAFNRVDALIAAAFDLTEYSVMGNVRLFVWPRSTWESGFPTYENALHVSQPLDYGDVDLSSKPPLFGGISSGNAASPDFRFLKYRLLTGTFSPITLPAGEYMVGLYADNGLTFELASSSIEKTGNVLPGDMFYDITYQNGNTMPELYTNFPEFNGTAALDLFYEDSTGGYGASLLSSAATVPEPKALILALAGLAIGLGRYRVQLTTRFTPMRDRATLN